MLRVLPPTLTPTEEGTTTLMEQRACLFDLFWRNNGVQKKLASPSSCPCPRAHLLTLGMSYPPSYAPPPIHAKMLPGPGANTGYKTQDNSGQNSWDQLGKNQATLYGVWGPNHSPS